MKPDLRHEQRLSPLRLGSKERDEPEYVGPTLPADVVKKKKKEKRVREIPRLV